jgi:hypothetical protein
MEVPEMSDLVERLRHWMPIDLEDARWMRNAAAARIEALEAALREIANWPPSTEIARNIARAALAPEQDK